MTLKRWSQRHEIVTIEVIDNDAFPWSRPLYLNHVHSVILYFMLFNLIRVEYKYYVQFTNIFKRINVTHFSSTLSHRSSDYCPWFFEGRVSVLHRPKRGGALFLQIVQLEYCMSSITSIFRGHWNGVHVRAVHSRHLI